MPQFFVLMMEINKINEKESWKKTEETCLGKEVEEVNAEIQWNREKATEPWRQKKAETKRVRGTTWLNGKEISSGRANELWRGKLHQHSKTEKQTKGWQMTASLRLREGVCRENVTVNDRLREKRMRPHESWKRNNAMTERWTEWQRGKRGKKIKWAFELEVICQNVMEKKFEKWEWGLIYCIKTVNH